MFVQQLAAVLVLVTSSSLLSVARAGLCPDLKTIRSEYIMEAFDVSKMTGNWYEVAFHDIAQVGASCQRFNNTLDSPGLVQAFKTKYGPIPFKQTYKYDPVQDENGTMVPGVFTNYLEGAKNLLKLPTVIVDVQTNDEDQYVTYTQFTCKEEAGLAKVTELRVSSRSKTVSDDVLAGLKKAAIEYGVPSDVVNGLREVDHSKCQD
eukprot:g371.t1